MRFKAYNCGLLENFKVLKRSAFVFSLLITMLQAEKLVSDVLFLEVLVISCIISKKNVTFVMRSLLK